MPAYVLVLVLQCFGERPGIGSCDLRIVNGGGREVEERYPAPGCGIFERDGRRMVVIEEPSGRDCNGAWGVGI